MFHLASMSLRMASDQGLGAEHAHLQRQLGHIYAQLLGDIPKVYGEAGAAAHHGGAEVFHKINRR